MLETDLQTGLLGKPNQIAAVTAGLLGDNLASSTRSECRTETTAENAPPSSADSRTLVVNRCRAGVRRLWRLVARPQVGHRPTPVRRVLTLLAARCDTGSGATASPQDRLTAR